MFRCSLLAYRQQQATRDDAERDDGVCWLAAGSRQLSSASQLRLCIAAFMHVDLYSYSYMTHLTSR